MAMIDIKNVSKWYGTFQVLTDNTTKIEKGEVVLAFSEKGDRPKEFKSDNEAILLRLKKVEK